ncbi:MULTISPECIES: EthD domain-containing protein [Pseudoxanthomonas]|uniref:EthD domain-containing protein n=1 Tax=Pseudoxanthomonas winnipegensis TaxID=2480810 RepID=A0AAW8GGR7_9GAMM|nr:MULTISPECIES: EthD domain-containing protein [Pseudoxanthomonas]MDQ1120465.1 hypothetical protein [Pseudoxanthomonas winnipegensis]MDQ1133684.1 hypothetical protein [Pseudoxanthomonas winnipegensis]MDR6140076.1 hypothetical protein [Pseudoxanthomonas sp. SORGH_AS_0997]
MIKTIAAIRRKPGMTQQEYFRYILEVHGALAKARPLTVRRYVQSHVLDGAYGAATDSAYQVAFHRDSVTELHFDNVESMMQNFGDPYVRDVLGPDGAHFNDFPSALALLAEDTDIRVAHPGDGAVRVMYFLGRQPEVTDRQFRDALRQAVQDGLDDAPDGAPAVRRAVLSHAIHDETGLIAYFGSSDMPAYDAVLNLWFDPAQALAEWRAWQAGFELRMQQSTSHDRSHAFFLMTREHVII